MPRPKKKYSQASRLHDILRLIEARHGVTLAELVEETSVDKRTIFRDIKAIEDAGFPIEVIRNGRTATYRLQRNFKEIPPITFTRNELFSLYLLKAESEILAGTPIHQDIIAAFRKINAALPPRLAAHIERMSTAPVSLSNGKRDYRNSSRQIEKLRDALIQQKEVKITYQALQNSNPSLHHLHPYSIVIYKGGLYLTGYSKERDEIRTFAVDKITDVDNLSDLFEIPSGYNTVARSRDSFGIVYEKPVSVRILFSKDMAEYISSRQWHPSQKVKQQRDGKLLLEFKAGGKMEIISWILSHGSKAELLQPLEWRKEIEESASEMFDKYHGNIRKKRFQAHYKGNE